MQSGRSTLFIFPLSDLRPLPLIKPYDFRNDAQFSHFNNLLTPPRISRHPTLSHDPVANFKSAPNTKSRSSPLILTILVLSCVCVLRHLQPSLRLMYSLTHFDARFGSLLYVRYFPSPWLFIYREHNPDRFFSPQKSCYLRIW